jgi:hypothetical protein
MSRNKVRATLALGAAALLMGARPGKSRHQKLAQ